MTKKEEISSSSLYSKTKESYLKNEQKSKNKVIQPLTSDNLKSLQEIYKNVKQESPMDRVAQWLKNVTYQNIPVSEDVKKYVFLTDSDNDEYLIKKSGEKKVGQQISKNQVTNNENQILSFSKLSSMNKLVNGIFNFLFKFLLYIILNLFLDIFL